MKANRSNLKLKEIKRLNRVIRRLAKRHGHVSEAKVYNVSQAIRRHYTM